MQELTGAGKSAAKTLIKRLPSPIYALSVVDNRADGRVFVDDPQKPGVAIVWESTGNAFISGNPTPESVLAIADVIVGQFIPEAVSTRSRPMCFIAYSPDSWGTHLPSILKGYPPIEDTRLCYRAEGTDDFAVSHLSRLTSAPADSEVRAADDDLLKSGLTNIDEVRSEAQKMWGTLDRFLKEGFGYCVVSGEAVTSWSLTECPSGDRCSVGVETVEGFQRRGHATAAAANTLLRARREGIRADWDLWASNEPSLNLAEKLGLTRVAEYPIHFFWFDRVDNMLVNGRVASRRDRREEAATWFRKAFETANAASESKSSWLLSSPERRVYWLTLAADVCEKAGRLTLAKEYRERAAREV